MSWKSYPPSTFRYHFHLNLCMHDWISDILYKTARSHLRQVAGWGIKQCIEQKQSDRHRQTHTHTHTRMYTRTQIHTHRTRTRTGTLTQRSVPFPTRPPKLLLFVGNSSSRQKVEWPLSSWYVIADVGLHDDDDADDDNDDDDED